MGHRPFLVLADHFTRNGLAVLRFDDRGVGGSEGSLLDATTEDFAEDALAGVRFLRTREEVDVARVGLLGHSEGATVAAIAAAKSREVAFLILVAPPGVTGEELLYGQAERLMTAMEVDAALIEANRKMQAQLFQGVKMHARGREEEIRAVQQKALAHLSDSQKEILGLSTDTSLEDQARLLMTPWFRFMLTYDPAEALRQVRCPTLALFGERDMQVPVEQNLPAIQEALEAAPTVDYQAVRLPNLNHLMQTSSSGLPFEYSQIEETISPSVLDLMTSWLGDRTGEPTS